MRKFELSEDCILENSSKTIAETLIKGAFVVGCDIKNKQLVLENVFHYTRNAKRLEIYTLFPNEDNTKRQLKLDMAFVFMDKKPKEILDGIIDIINLGVDEYDRFVVDKYNNLYTKIVYDKYGGSMALG